MCVHISPVYSYKFMPLGLTLGNEGLYEDDSCVCVHLCVCSQ